VERFRDTPSATVLGFDVPVATTRRERLLGLAFLDRVEVGEGLYLPSCRCIHTFGMRFAIDVLFLDPEGRVIELRREVPPGRVVRCRAADSVLELSAPASPPP
jgi:uncharacterized protein